MRLKEKNLLQKFAATLKKFSEQGAKKVEYGTCVVYSLSVHVVQIQLLQDQSHVLFNDHLRNIMAFDILSTVFEMRKGISAPVSHVNLFSRNFSLFSWKEVISNYLKCLG